MRDETRSFAYTRAVLHELDLGVRREVDRLGGNEGLISILDRLRIESGEECVIWIKYTWVGRLVRELHSFGMDMFSHRSLVVVIFDSAL